ncbi:unnamed protein product [Lampetra planeri]
MARLADYFVVVEYDEAGSKGCGDGRGKILQRFPAKEWEDAPFPQGLELFCQPSGWKTSTERVPPSFFVVVLTDINSERHYCACLTFQEPFLEPSVSALQPQGDGEEEEQEEVDDTGLVKPAQVFAPKSLVLVSRRDCTEIFRNCLGLLYTAHTDSLRVPLETLVGNLLSCVVPTAGGAQKLFSLGAGDRQVIQAPLNDTLPITGSSVAILFRQLGIRHVLNLFCAAVTEHKVLFHSSSYQRLSDACRAMLALMFPLKYSYPYIPILPAQLLEVLSTPTPFIIGVHSMFINHLPDLLDVIVVELDGGTVAVPECVHLPLLPEPLLQQTLTALSMVLNPDLGVADNAFPPSCIACSPLDRLDKELRAIFLRLFGRLLQGYRSCLQLVRVQPTPVLRFHKSAFLGQRGLVEDDFLSRLLEGMSFATFISDRGPPYRPCDIFDELVAFEVDRMRAEEGDRRKTLKHVMELAHQLYSNENPNPHLSHHKVPRPTDGAHLRLHQQPFPPLAADALERAAADASSRQRSATPASARIERRAVVPAGPPAASALDRSGVCAVLNSARRLEVIKNCITYIFENNLLEAKKALPAALRALKGRLARQAFAQELGSYAQQPRTVLDHQQFDYVVRMVNCALQDCSCMDEYGVAAALLPITSVFCRKLSPGVVQFAYTCVQEHPVWTNTQFWEAAFYNDVQRDIRALYLPQPDSEVTLRAADRSALDVAAERLRSWRPVGAERRREEEAAEEGVVFSQAVQYAHRMACLLVPLDTSRGRGLLRASGACDGESGSNSVPTNSVGGSVGESFDMESGFEEADGADVAGTVTRFVMRFADKVCTECGVTNEHVRALDAMLPGIVALHLESLEAVHRESKRLPPIQKPKIVRPLLLPGEELLMEGLRAVLLPDGRDGTVGGRLLGGPPLLPAEGAVFLTTYRVMFRGAPSDPLVGEYPVVRSFPVSSLTKEKRVSVHAQLHQDVHEGLQLQSATFQLLKLGFDVEVSSETVEGFRRHLARLRFPPSALATFALSHCAGSAQSLALKPKEKHNQSIVSISKNIVRNAKAGMRTIGLQIPTKKKLGMQPGHCLPVMQEDDTLSISEDGEPPEGSPTLRPERATLERRSERLCCLDYQRLGLGTLSNSLNRAGTEPFRITAANRLYHLCHSYPGLLIVPQAASDAALQRVSRCYRQGRLPVVCWRHPRARSVLLRSGGLQQKGVVGGLFRNPSPHGSGNGPASSESSASLEQEKYLLAIMATMPGAAAEIWGRGVTVRGSQANHDAAKWGSLRVGRRFTSSSSTTSGSNQTLNQTPADSAATTTTPPPGTPRLDVRGKTSGGRDPHQLPLSIHKAALYVVGDKAQLKGWRKEGLVAMETIPVEMADLSATRSSFRKLLHACCPSSTPTDSGSSAFLTALEQSEWLPQLQRLLQLSGLVVELLEGGSSVIVGLEDGWDTTTQVVSLVQLLSDPFYRTLDGFRLLIEKEWLAFGHRFGQRSNMGAGGQSANFTPVFLQFLDCVHQLQYQFPTEFEFNDYYLRFLAYHHVSNRFRTFLLDSDYERIEQGVLYEEKGARSCGQSLWEYVDSLHRRAPLFYSFLYSPGEDSEVLRLCCSTAALHLWGYYTGEALREGPPYDPELLPEAGHGADEWAPDGGAPGGGGCGTAVAQSSRRTLWWGYDGVARTQPDAITAMLQEIQRLETALGRTGEHWKETWDRARAKQRRRHLKTSRSPCQQKGSLVPSGAPYSRPSLGSVGASLKALDAPFGDPGGPGDGDSVASWAPTSSGMDEPQPPLTPDVDYYSGFPISDSEQRSYEGVLYKRGALLKGWKARWFVLDKTKHQLRYYDTADDQHCRGEIDLGDVESVTPATATLGAPKNMEDKAFFDVRTTKRVYNFCAQDAASAQQWSDHIQGCLSDA